ncbi:hypothetical protein FZEAL_2199 [Fusarium zealandicum]|uniref:N-acetyltransferase domain-containing protein n=1 Tax=Fusarium zealandicum TaxID=1053134 RepID=A0A8H4XMY8_9HYPO|nr:hypothetical protein FZEAL_2199 [Fusarium zealandicum]
MSEPTTVAEEPPPLALEVLTNPKEKKDALKLIVDSVAQQRQVASRSMVFHPMSLAALVGVLSIAHYVAGIGGDISTMLITYPGIILAYLVTIRCCTSSYIRIAEDTDWLDWLNNSDGVEDTIVGARFGEDIIAAVIIRFETGGKKALIRGWTTRTKYRRRGLGGDMLRETVKIAKQAQGRTCVVEFADDHANSNLPINAIFNGPFRTQRDRAKQALSVAVKDWETDKSVPQ